MSFRFSDYKHCIELCFSKAIVGAQLKEYLLEKSRIVYQTMNERNYHVFYEMLSGMSENQKSKYGLSTPHYFHYLNQVRHICEVDWNPELVYIIVTNWGVIDFWRSSRGLKLRPVNAAPIRIVIQGKVFSLKSIGLPLGLGWLLVSPVRFLRVTVSYFSNQPGGCETM